MNEPEPVTPEQQFQPAPQRQAFLRGVLEEAHEQGYSAEAQGRLVVIALRAREGR